MRKDRNTYAIILKEMKTRLSSAAKYLKCTRACCLSYDAHALHCSPTSHEKYSNIVADLVRLLRLFRQEASNREVYVDAMKLLDWSKVCVSACKCLALADALHSACWISISTRSLRPQPRLADSYIFHVKALPNNMRRQDMCNLLSYFCTNMSSPQLYQSCSVLSMSSAVSSSSASCPPLCAALSRSSCTCRTMSAAGCMAVRCTISFLSAVLRPSVLCTSKIKLRS